MGRYKSVLMAEKDARAFPFHVDVEVPPMGLGKQMDVMADWLAAHVGDDWRRHGQCGGGGHVSRYMFRSRADAEAFAAALADGRLAPPA